MKKIIIAAALIAMTMTPGAYAADTAAAMAPAMSAKDAQLVEKILGDLDAANAKQKTLKSAKSRDCIDDCGKSYDSCMASAGSPLEKAVCKSDYTKCMSDC